MGRMRGCLWLTAGLVVAVLAGAVAFITLQRMTGAGPTEGVGGGPRVPVVVAASAVEVRSLLTDDNVELRQLPVNAVPEGAVRELEEAVGKITLVDLYPGEVILAQRLVDPNIITGDGRLALAVAEDQVLMAVSPVDLMSRINILKPGDHVDLLFSLQFPMSTGVVLPAEEGEEAGVGVATEEEQVTFFLLQNIVIAAIVGEENEPQAILVTVSPEDALVLKYAVDAEGIQDILLRAPGAEQPFEVEPVDIEFMINRYRIPTGGAR
jgi:pilus assembly protein CpaB